MKLEKFRPFAKAVIGFVTPRRRRSRRRPPGGLPGGSSVTFPEWVGIRAAMVLPGGALFATPNKAAKQSTDGRQDA